MALFDFTQSWLVSMLYPDLHTQCPRGYDGSTLHTWLAFWHGGVHGESVGMISILCLFGVPSDVEMNTNIFNQFNSIGRNEKLRRGKMTNHQLKR